MSTPLGSGAAPGNPGLVWYDPAADAWSDQVPYAEHPRLHLYSPTASPDGTVYAVGHEGPELWAINPQDGSALPVELPDGIGDWRVDLAWHEDALYAIGRGGAWRFTPDS